MKLIWMGQEKETEGVIEMTGVIGVVGGRGILIHGPMMIGTFALELM
ncbi:hypothetical protein CCP4SC76_4240003 [Gammaproteobacteria bacterium]